MRDRPPRLFDRGSAADPGATVEGTVAGVVFASEETGWSVLRVERPGEPEPVTAVGSMVGVHPGERLRLTGRWENDRRFGRQFRVDSYVSLQPSTLEGMEKYLGSGLVTGVGPVMARRLVKRFGLETLEVLENDPERLTEVPGIGRERSRRLQEAWARQRHVRDVMIFLQGHSISPRLAARIVKRYGPRAMARVKENPYRLARDIAGIGFAAADRIALSLGMAENAPERVDAATRHAVSAFADEGHVFAPREAVIRRVADLLGRDAACGADAALERLVGAGELHVDDKAGVYGMALWTAETALVSDLARLIRSPGPGLSLDGDRAVAWYEERHGLELAARQREAVLRGLSRKVLVITGGPGTGKTTLVRAILRILEAKGARILQGAPTGRAAKRLAEATRRDARTLHRLLEYEPRRGRFARNHERPLEADLLVVDEASMVDVALAHHLLRAVPSACRLILVGDVDQLPSVGPGSFLGDLIDSGVLDVVRLTEIFRQAGESLIVTNAHRIRDGSLPLAETSTPEGDFFFIRRQEPEEILETIRDLVTRRIPSRFGLDPVEDVQILTPMNRGLLGTVNLNRWLQENLNPGGDGSRDGPRGLRPGDKVMQVRNNYDLEVFNGDLGRVEGPDPEGGLRVRFDGRRVTYSQTDLDELTLAYACSIHKSQGNEYPAVVIPVHTQHAVMLQRNLLYTAVTRGKRLVLLVGTPRAVAMAVRNARQMKRNSRLAERLRRCF